MANDAQTLQASKKLAWAVGAEDIMVGGSFQLDSGVSATHVKSGTQKGIGWSVAYSGIGVFTITLFNAVHDIKMVVASLQPASGLLEDVRVTGRSASAGTITIQGTKIQAGAGDNTPLADALTNDGIIDWKAVVRMRTVDQK